jgi:hypothetical protein
MTSEKELREFYLEAMKKHWTLGTRRKPKSVIPGHEVFIFSNRNLTLVELCGESNLSSAVAGMINILDEKNLVWAVSYRGFCEKRAEPFLTEILAESFRNGTGSGIRGPLKAEGKKLEYHHLCRNDNRFGWINSREKILRVQIHKPNDQILAEINFTGGLIDENQSSE